MAWVEMATFVWKGDLGKPPTHKHVSRLADPVSSTTMINLLVALDAHTKCNKDSGSFISKYDYGASAPGVSANIDRKAIIFFRHPTTLKTHSFTIPSPVDADVEDTVDGERMKASAVSTIVGLINTATGISYAPLYGIVVQGR